MPRAARKVTHQKLTKCALITLEDTLDFKSSERLTIIIDASTTANLPHVLFEVAQEYGRVALIVVPSPKRVLDDPPVIDFLEKSEIVIACTSKYFPVAARERVLAKDGRLLLMHTATDDTLVRTIPIDYEALARALDRVGKVLSETSEFTMRSPGGTNLRFSCKGRPLFKFDGRLKRGGEFDSLPAGSIYSSPVEGTGEGDIVIDIAGYDSGPIRTPIKLKVEGGFVTSILGGADAERVRKLIEQGGENSGNLAEVGIGLNPKARVGLHPIESERSAGSVTIGFGRNTQMGGTVDSRVHLDIGMVGRATLRAGSEIVIQNGRLRL